MTLLQPWGAGVAGVVGIGVLTLLYVLKLRRRVVRVGSTLLWERALAEVEVNTPWRRLRIDWLYVVQALAIVCLAAALGRPAVGLSGTRQRVVFVIDASASMGAIDPGETGTRLSLAKQRAAALIGNLRRAGDLEGAVVAFGAEARTVRGFVRESAPLIEALDGVPQTDEPSDLSAALGAVASLTGGASAGEDAPPETIAYVFSDGGFDGRTAVSPAGVSLRLLRIGPDPAEPTGNVGIVGLAAQRDEADPATVRVVVRLVNSFQTERGASLRLSLDGQALGSATASIPGRGEQTATVAVTAATGGVLSVRIANNDALASDNEARVLIDGRHRAAVLVVAAGGSRGADPLVVNFAQAVGDQSRVVSPSELAAMGTESVRRFDLLVFDRVDTGNDRALPPVPSISLGAGLEAAGVRLRPTPPHGPATERIVTWKRDHPLMREVALDGLVLRRPGTLAVPDRGVVLAEGVAGPLMAAVDGPDGVARVVSALSAEQGAWGSDLSFVVFMGNALDNLTLRGRFKAGRQWATGESPAVRIPPGVQEVTVRAPDGSERRIAPPVELDAAPTAQRVIGLGTAALAGVYSVAEAVEDDRRLAVNLESETESRLATADTLPVRMRGAGVEGRSGGRPPREVWDWFLLGALGLLGVEWLMYAVLARR
ncbi:MAG: BatA and WFA domain-containing protein [Phycisphaerales bacterium]|nr:BatA and WFA domain-containing protein [Phycisphaerales bacterium]